MAFDYEKYNEDLVNYISDFEIRPEIKKFCKINKKLTNFTKYQISIEVSPDAASDMGIEFDMKARILSQLVNQMNLSIYKSIIRELLLECGSKPIEFMDVRTRLFRDPSCLEISNYGYENLISSGMIVSEFMNSAAQIFSQPNLSTNSMVFDVGKIKKTRIWVDPHMRFADERMAIFNIVEINVEIRNLSAIRNNNPLNPMSMTKIILNYDFDLNIGDSAIVYLIRGAESSGYKQFIKSLRNEKIDTIIGL